MKRGIFGRRSHGEFVAIQFAEHDRAGGFHASHGGAVVGRNVALENLGPGGGAQAARAHDIFNADGHAAQRRQRLAFGRHAVDAVGLLECAFFRKRQKRADLSIFFLNAGIVRFGERERRGFALLNGRAGRIDR